MVPHVECARTSRVPTKLTRRPEHTRSDAARSPGTNRDRPGLREAIAEDLAARHVKLSLVGSVYDPTDPVGRLLFNVLAMVAEFEAD